MEDQPGGGLNWCLLEHEDPVVRGIEVSDGGQAEVLRAAKSKR